MLRLKYIKIISIRLINWQRDLHSTTALMLLMSMTTFHQVDRRVSSARLPHLDIKKCLVKLMIMHEELETVLLWIFPIAASLQIHPA